VVSDLLQPIPGKGLDVGVVGFFGSTVRILVEPKVLLSVERLRVVFHPILHLIGIHQDGIRIRINPCLKLVKGLAVVVLADTGIDAKIPAVNTTDQVFPFNMPIGQ
jgi:hypothetical protein